MKHLPRCTIDFAVDESRETTCPDCLTKTFSNCKSMDLPTALKLRELQHQKSFEKRSIIQHEGDPAATIGIVNKGTAAVVKHTEDGKRQIVGFLSDGDLFGISPDDEYFASIEAITNVDTCLFPKAEFETLIAGHPQLSPDLLRVVSHELAEAANHTVLLGQLTSSGRIAAYLCERAERLRAEGLDAKTVTLEMTRSDLGDYLGISMEHVSRALGYLAGEGLIRVVGRRNVEILNFAGLQEAGLH
ncbi:MAG: Crp/Fnr family transcriptional regulator [Pseudomonadota bacterium]